MATTIQKYAADKEGTNIVVTFTAASDATQPMWIPPGTIGSIVTYRSAAETYTVTLEVSQDGTNWFTGATVSDAGASSAISATAVAVCRLCRVTLSALGGAATITAEIGFRR